MPKLPRGKIKNSEDGIDFGAVKRKRVTIDFTDRAQVESFVQSSLAELVADYDALKASISAIIVSLQRSISKSKAGVDMAQIRALEQQQQRLRQVCGDKQGLIEGLIKRFELLAQLDRPQDLDPRYTPVTLTISDAVPDSARTTPVATLDADEIQPPQ